MPKDPYKERTAALHRHYFMIQNRYGLVPILYPEPSHNRECRGDHGENECADRLNFLNLILRPFNAARFY